MREVVVHPHSTTRLNNHRFWHPLCTAHIHHTHNITMPTISPKQLFSFNILPSRSLWTQLVKAQGLSPTRGLSPTFLDALAAHDIRVAAVTNAPKQNVAVMLEALQLGDLFEVGVFVLCRSVMCLRYVCVCVCVCVLCRSVMFEVCVGVCVGMCVGVCVGMCVGVCIGMCIGVCVNVCRCVCKCVYIFV